MLFSVYVLFQKCTHVRPALRSVLACFTNAMHEQTNKRAKPPLIRAIKTVSCMSVFRWGDSGSNPY